MIDTVDRVVMMMERDFRVRVVRFQNFRPEFLSEASTALVIKNVNSWQLIDDNLFFQIRDSLESHGWHLSRQKLRTPPFEGVEHHYLAPIKNVCVETLYHATREVNVQVILHGGLRAARREDCNFDRLDTIGNIYGSSVLGAPGDWANSRYGTAHWWAELFARDNRFNDPNWRILEVDLRGIDGLTCFRDIWSQTGIIIRPTEPIPAYRITLVS
jgi:hypothetical protein